tara:strand:- start:444 stop:1265 length:822 start_codon:yes stop_codon:yes gene_type:complete
MAETLTFDNTTEQTSVDSLTAEEQDSLKLGTEIQEQQEQLLAGKYKDAQELEKAYVELQKKFGEKDTQDSEGAGDTESPDAKTETEETEEAAETTAELALLKDASTEYYENNGQLSAETIEKFQSMSSTDLVNTYLNAIKGTSIETGSEATVDLSQNEINVVQNAAGGEKAYGQLVDWASENLSEADINSFDALVSSGNVGAIKLAVSGLRARYEDANGYEGRMLQGKAPKSSGDVFRSQAELVSAMSDPRYDKDPAYRQDVVEKLDRSDLKF